MHEGVPATVFAFLPLSRRADLPRNRTGTMVMDHGSWWDGGSGEMGKWGIGGGTKISRWSFPFACLFTPAGSDATYVRTYFTQERLCHFLHKSLQTVTKS